MNNSMNILFIGVAASSNILEESDQKYNKNKKSVRPQQHFDFKLVNGLAELVNIRAISEPPVASYPKSKCFFYKRKKEDITENLQIRYLGIINLLIIKTFLIGIGIFYETLTYILEMKKCKKNFTIMTGYISFYTFFPIYILSKLYKIKIVSIVPDVPSYLLSYTKEKNKLKSCLYFFNNKINEKIQKKYDGYIFLTKYMDELINSNKNPYIVIEGFISEEEIKILKEEIPKKEKIIMYAGTLHEKFGIKKLINAFEKINLNNWEFWIFGDGDSKSFIEKQAKKNTKIKYMGTKTKDEILRYEKIASLLINPRPSNEIFTKYSFPSKTIEYMASGTPLLTTKLLGIPKEYFEFIYIFEDENNMTEEIKKIILKSEEELVLFGKRAQIFIENNKTLRQQSIKIIEFINSIY